MKKVICLLLALCMLSGLTSALAAQDDRTLLEQDYSDESYYEHRILDIDSDGGQLYILADGKILTYRQGDSEPQVLISDLVTAQNWWEQDEDERQYVACCIFAEDGVLTVLDTCNGALFTLSADEAGKPVYGERVLLEMNARVEEENHTYLNFQFESAMLSDGKLYVNGYDFEQGGELELFVWDAATGAPVATSIEWTQQMCAYKDGKILVVTGENRDMYDSEADSFLPWSLCEYDPQTDTMTEVTKANVPVYYDVNGMAYDETTDTLYIVTASRIYRMEHLQNPELAAYHPVTSLHSEGKNFALLGTQAAVYDSYGLYLRTPDPAQLPASTLSIFNYYASDEHLQAVKGMGDIPVFFMQDTYFNTAQELGQALSSGENQIDVLVVTMEWMDFERLMAKGYCYDLSGNDVISAYVNDLYPFIREAVTSNGKLMGVPVSIHANGWKYNPEAFAALGLETPRTYGELVELMNAWASEDNEENWEEYTLLGEEGSYKEQVVQTLLSCYEQYMLNSGEGLTLDNALLREVMTQVETMDTGNVEVHVDWSSVGDEMPEELDELWEKTSLLYSYYSIMPERYESEEPLLLKLNEDCDYILPVSVTVMFINPRSRNLDAAVMYVENLVKAMSQSEEHMIGISPNHNEPVLNNRYEETLARMQESITQREDALAKADPIDKPMLEADIESYREYVHQYEEEERYTISEEDIAAYREIMQYAVLKRPSVMNSSYEEGSFYSLVERYLDGQLALEQFIMEGSSKLRLMQLENQ